MVSPSLRRPCRRPRMVTTARTLLAISHPASRQRREARWFLIRGMASSRTTRPMGSPTASSIPIRRLLMARIHHMVRACTGGRLTIRVDMRRTPSVGGRSGSVLRVSFGLILGISAIVVGVLGMRAANEGRASNKGLSIAGVVTGAIGAVIGACYLMLFFIVMLSQ